MIEPAIREARFADVEAVLPLVEEFVTSFDVDRAAFLTSFQKLIVDDSALILVAETEVSLVGYCLGFVHGTLQVLTLTLYPSVDFDNPWTE